MKLKEANEIHKLFEKEIADAPCSVKHHLNERGGLLKHLIHVRDCAEVLDEDDETLIALAWIHDIGKARSYTIKEDGTIIYSIPSVDHHLNTIAMIGEAGIKLTQEELNAIQYHHGGFSPFASSGQATELAVKLHYCDWLATIREGDKR
jgi:23S rRNA maturation-related 3'-5' exoribonuclease YhaM